MKEEDGRYRDFNTVTTLRVCRNSFIIVHVWIIKNVMCEDDIVGLGKIIDSFLTFYGPGDEETDR